MSTCQLPEFGTFRCSGSSVHSRFLGPGVIPKTLWNIMKLCVTVTLGIMAASWLHQIQPTIPRRKNTTTVLRGCCLRFVLKPVFSQATRVDIEDEQIHPAASRPLRTSIKSKIDFQHVSWYKTIISPKKWWDYIYIYIPILGRFQLPSNPIMSDVLHETLDTYGSLMGLRGKQQTPQLYAALFSLAHIIS